MLSSAASRPPLGLPSAADVTRPEGQHIGTDGLGSNQPHAVLETASPPWNIRPYTVSYWSGIAVLPCSRTSAESRRRSLWSAESRPPMPRMAPLGHIVERCAGLCRFIAPPQLPCRTCPVTVLPCQRSALLRLPCCSGLVSRTRAVAVAPLQRFRIEGLPCYSASVSRACVCSRVLLCQRGRG